MSTQILDPYQVFAEQFIETTLGYTEIFGNSQVQGSNRGPRVQAAGNGFIDSISFYTGFGGDMNYGVYLNTGKILIGETGVFTGSGITEWQTRNLITPIAITDLTFYYLIAGSDISKTYHFDVGGGGPVWRGGTTSVTLENPMTGLALNTTRISMYANVRYEV